MQSTECMDGLERELGLEKIPLADEYEKEAIATQRKNVNKIISDGMNKSTPFITIPFSLFAEIKNEMYLRGWMTNGQPYYYPVWLINMDAQVEIKDESDKVISAEAFYKSTLREQLYSFKSEVEKARESGLAELRLEFAMYKILQNNLIKKGWLVYSYISFEEPYTLIKTKY